MSLKDFNHLNKDEYAILRESHTEPPFSGSLLNNKQSGIYSCKACFNPLFSSKHKFDSESGWPSFYDILDDNSVVTKIDYSHNMLRTEVLCKKCRSHLGHIFDDAKNMPTNKRYCINSLALNFKNKSV